MEYVEKLRKNKLLSKINITDEYRALIELAFYKNKLLYYAEGKLTSNYENLDIVSNELIEQQRVSELIGEPMFVPGGKYPLFNKLFEFDEEYLLRLYGYIQSHPEYTKLLKYSNCAIAKGLVISVLSCNTKYGNQFIKMKIRTRKNRILLLYGFENIDRLATYKGMLLEVIYEQDKYYKIIKVFECDPKHDELRVISDDLII